MVHFRVLFFVSVSTVVFSCNPEVQPHERARLSDLEDQIVGSWRYSSIQVNGSSYSKADQIMEPFGGGVESLRDLIDKRGITYSADKAYQLRWTTRGDYQMGSDSGPNWQPFIGYWNFNATGDSLIHNNNQGFEVRYGIRFSRNTLIRTSIRTMEMDEQNTNNPSWKKGDQVIYTEFFRKAEF